MKLNADAHLLPCLICLAALTILVPVLLGDGARPSVTAAASQGPDTQQRDRTAPFVARMTPTQRYHSQQHKSFRTRTRILDRRESVVLDVDEFLEAVEPRDVAIQRSFCSQFAFVGSVASLVSNPVEDGTFLFTDYTVRVDDVLRMPPGFRVTSGDFVVVSRPGGEVTVDGEVVRATINLFPRLRVTQKYLFFAKYLPPTKTFITHDPRGVFRLRNGSFVPLIDDVRGGSQPPDAIEASEMLASLRRTRCN